MPVQSEKIIVFDESGNPKELRYYEAEKLVARLGTILDGDSNFIGLRELDIEEVSPQSWFNKLRHKPQPKQINILTVDFIGLINWINTIKTIKTIENIDVVKLITEISNISSINLIDRVALIDAITSIGTVGAISDIQGIIDVHAINYVKNGFFETGDLRGWNSYVVGGAAVAVEAEGTPSTARGNYYVKLTSTVAWAYLWQFIEPVRTINCRASVLAKTDASAGTFSIIVRYTDGTTNLTNVTPNTNWTEYSVSFTADKVAVAIQINNTKDNSVVYIDNVVILPVQEDVSQAIRTSLLVKPEREDLLLKDLDLSASASLQAYLAAVANQKHKVYAYGYEADADGVYYFSATVSGSAFKFGRRITKGVYAQTLVHPIVCDVNTILNFMSTTGNSKVWIQYKTEA